jgi:hypothetical protein
MSNDFVIKAIALSLGLLSQRMFAFTCLLLTAGAFGWCLAQPDVLRIITASIFGVLCLMYIGRDSPTLKENNHELPQ